MLPLTLPPLTGLTEDQRVMLDEARKFIELEREIIGLKFSEDQPRDDHGRWTSDGGSGGSILPPLPGETPIPPGTVRLFHITPLRNASSIREHGLLRSSARGETYGEPNQVWAAAGTGSSQAHDVTDMTLADKEFAVVEFYARPEELDIGQFETPASLEARRSDVTMRGDVPPEQIIAVHEPWESAYRMLTQYPETRQEILDGQFDIMLDNPAYAQAIQLIKEGKGLKYSPDQERDEHGRWTSGGAATETEEGKRGQEILFEANADSAGDMPERLKAANVERIGLAFIEQAKTDPELATQLTLIGNASAAQGVGLDPIGFYQNLEEHEIAIGAAWAANALQATWAETSSDGSPVSVALQLTIDDHFSTGTDSGFLQDAINTVYEKGVEYTSTGWGVETPQGEVTVADMAQVLADSPVLNAYVDQVYQSTQAFLADKGITEVTLYRGMGDLNGDERFAGPSRVTMNPLSSWSTNEGIAEDFAASAGQGGVTLQATFSADRIFSVPQTGNGCLREYEVTVIGGPIQAQIVSGAGDFPQNPPFYEGPVTI